MESFDIIIDYVFNESTCDFIRVKFLIKINFSMFKNSSNTFRFRIFLLITNLFSNFELNQKSITLKRSLLAISINIIGT